MTHPNFESMSRKDLLTYILEHRDDQIAFYAYMDKLATAPVLAKLPPVTSVDVDDMTQVVEEILRNKRQQKSQ